MHARDDAPDTMTRQRKREASNRFAERLRKVAAAPATEGGHDDLAPRTDRAERKPTFKAATLTFITGDRIEVIVKNLSVTGARVEFMRNVLLPDRVLLSEQTTRLKVWAYVIWQEPGAAGLEFVAT